MRFQFAGSRFALTLEILWLDPEPDFRRYRVAADDRQIRRSLLDSVRKRMKKQSDA